MFDSRELGPDPGDRALLDRATKETRIFVTIDTDFGELIYLENLSHAGLIRLPDVPTRERQLIIQDLLTATKRTTRCCDHHGERGPDQNFERPKAELARSWALKDQPSPTTEPID